MQDLLSITREFGGSAAQTPLIHRQVLLMVCPNSNLGVCVPVHMGQHAAPS